ALVDQFARVFFHVNPRDADVVVGRPVVAVRCDPSARSEWPLVLGDLIALRQVRVEVVLARENRRLVNLASESERFAARANDGPPIEHRQRSGQSEAHRTEMCVGGGAECGTAAAEDLRLRQELRVNLETDDGLVRTHAFGPAARTSGVTSASKLLKLSTNIFA